MPRLDRIVGCNAVAGSTTVVAQCPAAGGAIITLFGSDLGVNGATVTVGVSACTNVVHAADAPSQSATCILPEGFGEQQPGALNIDKLGRRMLIVARAVALVRSGGD